MSPLVAKKRLKFFLQLEYPLRVTMQADGFLAYYPDLPGTRVMSADTTDLYQRADALRRDFIKRHIEAGLAVPLPNSGGILDERIERPAPLVHEASVTS